MDDRQQKQLTIGSVYLVILALIGFGVYWTGFRAPVATPTPIPIQALKVQSIQTVKTPANDYDVAIQLYNPNTLYGVTAGAYDLVFNDQTGRQAISKTGNAFYMLPGQTKYVVLSALTGIPDGATPGVQFKNLQWEMVAGDPSVDLQAVNASLVPAGNRTVASATIVNNSPYDFDTVDIALIVVDGSGKLITASTTNVQTMLNGTQRSITAAWPFAVPADAHLLIEVGTNVFNNDNFLKQHGTQEQFQQYF